jgi:hypothetical protein
MCMVERDCRSREVMEREEEYKYTQCVVNEASLADHYLSPSNDALAQPTVSRRHPPLTCLGFVSRPALLIKETS